MAVKDHAVIIAGGGPTGLMLAAELALGGVDVAIVERRATQELAGSRAGGLHARTLEILDQRGVVDRFLSEGQVAQVAGFAWFPLDISDLPTRYNHGLALTQNHIERILAAWVDELGVPVYRQREVTGFTQDDSGVGVLVSGGASLRAEYLVGCDGGRSVIRRAAGIDFVGWDPSISHLIAEARVEDASAVPWGLRRDALGIHALSPLGPDGGVRVMVTEQRLDRGGDPTLEDLGDTLVEVYGTDFGIHSPTWLSRFTDTARQAACYRQGRVLLAGDAAHVHYPAGGQGLNLGVQDAVNLGWKLAQVVRRVSADSLLDSYQAERHPVAARVLGNTLAQVALLRTDERTEALRGIMADVLGMSEPRRWLGAMISGLDVHYDPGDGHPLLGRRVPDLDLLTADGPLRLYSLLHDARPLLLELGTGSALDVAPWAGRVKRVAARYDGPWQLPLVGTVTAPAALVVRPDGHVAWVGSGTDAGSADALTRWFGPGGG